MHASENTKQALLQRELSQRQHDEMDAGLLMKRLTEKNVNKPTDKGLTVIGDRIEDVTKVGDSEEADKVKLSDDDMGEDEDYEGYEESNGEDGLAEEETLRCSGRLANKNSEDIPVMDRAKSLAAARNLDPSEGLQVKEDVKLELQRGARLLRRVAEEIFAAKGRWRSWIPRIAN